MEANFKQSLAWVRTSEGGNDDDPADSGGRTSRGITQREYDAYCRTAGLQHGDVWKAADYVVDDIYHRSYWMPYGPVMPPGVDYMLFDDSVLSGPVAAIKTLQRALGVAADGHIGILTSEAIGKVNPRDLVDEIGAARVQRYKAIVENVPKDLKFLRGWDIRVEFVMHNAHTLIGPNVTHT